MNNPIIQEVRAAREALAAKFDYDLHRIIADAIARQSHERTVNRQSSPNKRVQGTGGSYSVTASESRAARP